MTASILWISGGRVIDPANDRDAIGDVFAVDGKIVSGLSSEQKSMATKVDARGLIVSPGLVDIHVHLREPGQTHKENIATGSRAAAAGGFTTIVCMPNTTPPADNPGVIQSIQDAIKRDAVVRVLPTGCITIGQKGEGLAPIGSLKKSGVVAITDDGFCVQNNEIMRRASEYAKMFDLCIMDHCQDESLTRGSVMNEGYWSLRLGLMGWPNAAEDIIVHRDIALSTYTGGHIHLQHISSAYSVDAIRRAKERGTRITAEATPHHFSLTEERLRDYNTNFKMNPPLRTETDRQALISGLADGTLDCIATDHAPHTDYEKDVEFDYAPNGIIGLESAFSVSLQTLGHQCGFSIDKIIAWLTLKPSKILNLEAGTLSTGKAADIAIIDLDGRWEMTADNLQSQSANSPWLGESMQGRIKQTYVGGKRVWDGASITDAG